MNSATTSKQISAAEYRNAKAALEALLGASFKGLDGALRRSLDNLCETRTLAEATGEIPCVIKILYKSVGADVSADALKTLAYARMSRAFLACEGLA